MNTCRICKEELPEGNKSKVYCDKDHYRPCKECGEEYFVKKVVKPPLFCSGSCSAIHRSKNTKSEKKECKLCSKLFTPTNPNSKFCSDRHFKNCLKCGKEFEIKNVAKIKDYCSQQCSATGKTYRKICKRCHESFDTTDSRRVYCDRTHTSNCEKCGKSFIVKNPKKNVRFCSTSCASQKREDSKREEDEYIKQNTVEKECVVCGTKFPLNTLKSVAKTCSRKCAAGLINFSERNRKSAETLSKKYGEGITNPSQVHGVKQKKKDTLLKNYGVSNPSESEEIKARKRKTNLERYGVPNAGVSPESLEKIKKTNLEKYGVENVFQSEEIKSKIRTTLSENYGKGVVNPSQVASIREKMKATTLERYGVESYLSLPEVQQKSVEAGGRRSSKVNKKWKEKIEKLFGVECEMERLFAPSSYSDLSIGNIHIDINPTFTHNSTVSFVHATKRCKADECSDVRHLPRPKDYHHRRALSAQENGFTLLQYFDWFDEEIFLSVIRSKLKMDENKAYARNCEIRRITQKDANRFLKENHLLGPAKKQTFCVGAFYGEELVHVNTYGPARLNRNYQWEAIRSCSKMNWHVQGALQRCDKFFKNSESPESIVSYVDLAISDGSTESMNPGWSLKRVNSSSSTWVYCGLPEYLGDKPLFVKGNSARMVSADRLLKMEFGEKYPEKHPDGSPFTNEDVLICEGYLEMRDAGSLTFGWLNS